MKITNLEQLLEDELKDVYSAENQLLKALPAMAESAESKDLRASLENHLEQTQTHVQRIEEICRTAFRALWLRDYARLDVRLAPDGELWVLEANANPFISYGHDMANAAEKAGMDYYQFIQRLADEATARYERA